MRKELHCPQIIKDGKTIGYGGDQEWFPGDFQRLAGCGSVTGSNIAAIYALNREDFKDLYPIKDSQKAADYEQYLNLMQTMYRYMKPGFMGYPLIGRFAKDFKRYAKDHGITLSSEQLFLPKSREQALDFILPALKEDHPVAFLILRHPAHELREDNWHWVTITGFDEEEEKLIWSNCGECEEIDWNMLFDTDKKYYVGIVKFKNGNVVDVKNEQILQADIAVKDGKIAGIGHFSGENVIDCTGKYITPGFIDAHVHIESSMATPMEFSKAVMPHGTTTVIADPHELVNVKGNEAMEYILDAAGDAPLGIYVMMPSSIPATPFETNGADFTAEDMKQWKDHPLVLGLGEVMCYPAVLSKEEQIMKKLELCKGMVIDGHAPGLSGEDLKAYVEAGVMTDHECTSFEEAKEKCLAGMKILVREGSAARNVENIVPGLVKEPEFIAHFMFCTDDKHLDTIENEGHISYNIKKSIQLGMNPISAVKMATYNAAKTYGLNDIGVLEEGKDADIVILDSLESVEVHSVYKQGRIVNTEFFTKEAKPVNESMLHTVVLKNISKDKIQVKAEGKIPVIGMIPGQIVTKFLQEEVPSKDGLFTPDSEYSKLCVFERHRGTGNAAAAPIKGYGITNGAIATSVAHDSHNIIAAGDNDEDIIKAVQTIEEIQGGYALVSEGRVLGTLPLTVAGLLSQKPAKDIQKGIDELLQKAWKLGISRDIDPFITLSFMALPVIPSLRLTDLGLVDVDTFQLLKS